MAVYCAGLKMCGIVFRYRHYNAAIRRFHVELFATPTGAVQFDDQSTIHRATANGAADALQDYAAIVPAEFDAARYVGDGDAPIVGFEGKVRPLRDKDLVTNTPLIVLLILWTDSEDFATARFYSDLLYELISFSLRSCGRLHARPDKNLVLVPSFDGDSAVLTGIDCKQTASRHFLLTNFTLAYQTIVVPVIAASQRTIFLVSQREGATEA